MGDSLTRRKRFSFTPEGGMFSGRALAALILPLIVEQFLAVLVGMADTVMVTATGENAVSAVSLVDTLNVLLIQVFSAMGAGGAIIAAQYLGHKDLPNACDASKQLMLSSLILSTLVAVPVAIFRGPMLGLIYGRLDEDILRQAEDYLLLSALSYPFLALYNGGVGLLRAMGNSKSSMWTSLVMNLINIAGNALLIYGCGLGVVGAGAASLLSRAVSALIILKLLFNPHLPAHLEKHKGWRLEWGMIRRIMQVGVPNGLENGLFQVGKLVIAGVLAALPASMIAANAICNSVSSVVNIPGNAMALASITVIGQCMGAGDVRQARAYGNRMLGLMYASVFPTNLLLLLFPAFFAGIFNISPAGTEASIEIMRLYAIFSIILWTPSFGLPNLLRAAGDARYTMAVSMVSMLVLRLGMCYLMVYAMDLGLLGIWLAMFADWAARAAFFVTRYLNGKWLRHKLI